MTARDLVPISPARAFLCMGSESADWVEATLASAHLEFSCVRAAMQVALRAARSGEVVLCDVTALPEVLPSRASLPPATIILLADHLESAARVSYELQALLCPRSSSEHLLAAVRSCLVTRRSPPPPPALSAPGSLVQAGQRGLLERVAAVAPLEQILTELVQLMEADEPGMFCTILLVDEAGALHHGAAPSVPIAFSQALEGLAVGPEEGACGAAVVQRTTIFVEDIATHPYWAKYKHLALAHGLLSCWSSPILSSAGVVLGTFAVYYAERRLPTERELLCVSHATQIAAVAIERHRVEEALRRAEATLKESEEEFRIIFENAAIGTALVGEGGRLLKTNAALQNMLGYSDTELGALDFAALTHPDDLAADLEQYQRLIAGEISSYKLEKRFVRRDGQIVWGRLTASLVKPPETQSAFGIGLVEDISESKQAQERIASQAALLDKANDAILVRDFDGVIQYWNQGAQRLYGWSSEEAVGCNIVELMHGDPVLYRTAQRELLATGTWMGEIVQKTRLGEKVEILANWTLIRDERGAPKSVLAINSDITERKRLEAQVFAAQRLESLGTLAGGIAHDFNNILAAILAHVTLASEGLEPQHPLQEDLAEINQASLRAAALVRQILSFSRRGIPERCPTNLERVASEALKLLRATLPAAIRIDSDFEPELPDIFADPTQIHQVVMNLGTNAAHAMAGKGGVLTVSAERAVIESGFMVGTTELRPGLYVRLRVTDTGCGMDQETMSRIFDPFFTTKEPGAGTGLGLSVVHGVVRGHGAGLAVRSAPGLGTEFNLYLPVRHARSERPGSDALESPSTGHGEVLLCIDDDVSVLKGTTRLLEHLGYQPVGFTDPKSALESMSASPERFRGVVSDCAMPGIWGADLVKAIQQIRSDIPIMIISGLIEPTLAEHLRELGVREFIAKPCTMHKLANAVQRLLEGKQE